MFERQASQVAGTPCLRTGSAAVTWDDAFPSWSHVTHMALLRSAVAPAYKETQQSCTQLTL